MFNNLRPWQVFVVAAAGWLNREQRHVIDYLQEENRVLREQLGARRPYGNSIGIHTALILAQRERSGNLCNGNRLPHHGWHGACHSSMANLRCRGRWLD